MVHEPRTYCRYESLERKRVVDQVVRISKERAKLGGKVLGEEWLIEDDDDDDESAYKDY